MAGAVAQCAGATAGRGVPDGRTLGTLRAAAGRLRASTMTSARAQTATIIGALALVAIVPYLNSLSAGFTFDDVPNIVNNPVVTGGIDVVAALSTPLTSVLYRPLTILTFAVQHRCTPGEAWAFHATNLALHAGVTVLVFLLVRELTRLNRVAVVAATLFAVHPIHTEAVTNLVGRAEVLAALFGLGTLLLAVRTTRPQPRVRRVACDWAALGLFALAICSKESALTVAALVPLVRVTARGEPIVRGLRDELRRGDWIPYALVATVFVAARFVVVTALPPYDLHPLDNVLAFVPWWVRVPTAVAVLWEYLGLLVAPIVLSADYSYNQVPLVTVWWDPRFMCGAGLLLVAGLVVVRSRQPVLRFAVLFMFVALALTANVLFPVFTIKAERLLYFPSVGFVLLAALGFDALYGQPRYRRVAMVVLVVMVGGYAGRTWTRNADWQDNATLYRSMVRSAPDSAKARYNFGVALQAEGDDLGAVEQFERALALYQWSEGSAFGIGVAFDRKNVPDKAVEWYEKALTIEPTFERAHNNLCRLYVVLGQFDRANRACRAGLRHGPTNPILLWGLGESFAGRGDVAQAVAVLQRAQLINPADENLRKRLSELGTPPGSGDPASGTPLP